MNLENSLCELDVDDLLCEQRQAILCALTEGRLRSYFLAHPRAAKLAFSALNEAIELKDTNDLSGAFLLATSATELAVNRILLRPIVSGLLHDSSTSMHTASLAVNPNDLSQLVRLLFRALSKIVGFDLWSVRRPAAKQQLWDELKQLNKRRNLVVDRIHEPSVADADMAIAVAHSVLADLLPFIFAAVGLHVHEHGELCDDWTCSTPRTTALRGRQHGWPWRLNS